MNVESHWKVLLLIAFLSSKGIANECVPYILSYQVVGCVCNATYCDGLPDDEPEVPKAGSSYWYVSNKYGLRMKKSELKFGSCEYSVPHETLTIDRTKKYQKIVGFGGSFPDSTGMNIKKLSPATQEQLIRAYYDPKSGSGYSIGRIPVGGTDFSTRAYSYDDVANDTLLKQFSLAKEDYDYKIPFAKRALELNPKTLFFSSSWSAPPWMKTNNDFSGYGFLKEEHYQTYSDYLVMFLDEYKKNGIDIWAITTGNEPLNAFAVNLPIATMGWTPKMLVNWVSNYFGPTLAASSHNGTLIFALDDNRHVLPWFVEPIFENPNVSRYVAGTAVHWYKDFLAPAYLLDRTRNKFPDKFILMSEATGGPQIWNTVEVISQSWKRGEDYILSIIEYMNHWAIGWVDWNLALDETGGPSWINNTMDSAIIVNPENDEFYKQPMYYAIKHFSRFVDRGSVRIAMSETDAVKSTAFLTPSEEVVVVLYNSDVSEKHVVLEDSDRGTLCLKLSPQSMNTLKYKK